VVAEPPGAWPPMFKPKKAKAEGTLVPTDAGITVTEQDLREFKHGDPQPLVMEARTSVTDNEATYIQNYEFSQLHRARIFSYDGSVSANADNGPGPREGTASAAMEGGDVMVVLHGWQGE
jgi:hypothetical protein